MTVTTQPESRQEGQQTLRRVPRAFQLPLLVSNHGKNNTNPGLSRKDSAEKGKLLLQKAFGPFNTLGPSNRLQLDPIPNRNPK